MKSSSNHCNTPQWLVRVLSMLHCFPSLSPCVFGRRCIRISPGWAAAATSPPIPRPPAVSCSSLLQGVLKRAFANPNFLLALFGQNQKLFLGKNNFLSKRAFPTKSSFCPLLKRARALSKRAFETKSSFRPKEKELENTTKSSLKHGDFQWQSVIN